MKQLTPEQEKQLDDVRKYLRSKKGQKHLQKSLEKVNKRIDLLNEASKIDWKILNEPMTI